MYSAHYNCCDTYILLSLGPYERIGEMMAFDYLSNMNYLFEIILLFGLSSRHTDFLVEHRIPGANES